MKFRYLIVAASYEVTGTNNEKVAQAAAEFEAVYDVQEGKEIQAPSSGVEASDIEEETTYQPA